MFFLGGWGPLGFGHLSPGRILEVLSGHEGPVSRVHFSPVENVLVSGSWDKTIKVCNRLFFGSYVKICVCTRELLCFVKIMNQHKNGNFPLKSQEVTKITKFTNEFFGKNFSYWTLTDDFIHSFSQAFILVNKCILVNQFDQPYMDPNGTGTGLHFFYFPVWGDVFCAITFAFPYTERQQGW